MHVTVVGKCSAKPCPECLQVPHQQYCQQPLHSNQNTCSYSSSFQIQQQPLQNQTLAAQSQYYSSPGCHNQTMHRELTDFGRQAHSTQRHHSPMRSQYQRLIPASIANEYFSAWQQPGSSVNRAANIATAKSTSQYCGFADQRQAVIDKSQQRFDHNMRLKRQLSNGFGAGMQRGFMGGHQLQSAAGVAQDCQTGVLDMNESVNAGTADARKRICNLYQPCDTQTAGIAGHRPQQFIAPRHHVGISHQPMTGPDAFSSYQNPSVNQPNQSFPMQQSATWNSSQSYTQTGCCMFLAAFCVNVICLFRHTAPLALFENVKVPVAHVRSSSIEARADVVIAYHHDCM